VRAAHVTRGRCTHFDSTRPNSAFELTRREAASSSECGGGGPLNLDVGPRGSSSVSIDFQRPRWCPEVLDAWSVRAVDLDGTGGCYRAQGQAAAPDCDWDDV